LFKFAFVRVFVCLFVYFFVFNLQKPAPYRGMVYADLSHATDVDAGRINRVSPPTIYAEIDYLKTDAAKSRAPEENEDQTTKSIEA